MTELPATAALFAVLADASAEIAMLDRADRQFALKSAVCDAVDELKKMGLSSSRVETVLRRLTADACAPYPVPDVAGAIRSWCIQRYYDPHR